MRRGDARRPQQAATWAAVITSLVLAPVLEVGSVTALAFVTVHSTEAAVRFDWGVPISGDEFDDAGRPGPHWSVYDGPGHAGNGERRPSAWRGDGEVMTVHGSADGTTGGMSANWPGSDRRYGRWEVRMRTSVRDPRYHAVLLLWPRDDDLRGDCDGEVNFAESTKNLDVTKFFLHYDCDDKTVRAAIRNDTTRWHNYAVEWTADGIIGYIDGEPWFTDDDPDHQPPRPMHATLQLDYFPKDGRGPLRPTSMSVDWVREYAVPSSG